LYRNFGDSDIKIDIIISICSAVNKELQGLHTGRPSSFKREEWVRYVWRHSVSGHSYKQQTDSSCGSNVKNLA